MKLQRQKRMENTLSHETEFQIPSHWIEAAKIATKVLDNFKDKVSLDNFLTWNRYTKYTYFIPRKIPIYVIVKHTKHWLAECLTEPKEYCYIKININDTTLTSSDFYFYKTVFGTLIHELIHFFQENLGLENDLSSKEKKKLVLVGNCFKQDKQSFLYATNWNEMDAELGSYFIQHNFQVPTLKQLIQYFNDWYYDEILAKCIGTYVYDYFFGDKKKLKLRSDLFDGKIKFDYKLFL